jgi:hypothetical protein
MRKTGLFIVYYLLSSCFLHAQDSVYLFSYFKGNGEDGLHISWSNDGYKWEALKNDASFLKPVLSKDKLMRDPCVIRGKDGTFHMVWTVSWNERGIGYASSRDLLTWSEQQFIPVMAHEDSALNCWAPEITWDQKSKSYCIYWATTIAGRFEAGSKNGDGKYNHRMYYVTTKDFVKYSKTRLLYNKGFNVIDATIFPFGKQYAMILKDETRTPPQKNLRVAFSKKIAKGWSGPSEPITGNYWAEGPTVVKLGAEWVVYFDKYRDKKYGSVASTDLKNWKDISDRISFPAGTRHGTVFRVSKQEFETLQK